MLSTHCYSDHVCKSDDRKILRGQRQGLAYSIVLVLGNECLKTEDP